MLDHVALNVRDLDASKRFFEGALAPLGYRSSAFVLDPDGHNVEAVSQRPE